MSKNKRRLIFFIVGIDFSGEFVGGVEEGFGGRFDLLNFVFLGLGNRGGKKLGRKIDNSGNAGFEFEIQPEEKIGFLNGNGLGGLGKRAGLTADKPDQRGDKNDGNQGNEGEGGIDGLG